MPIIHIHMIKGRTVDQKRALAQRVTSAVVDTIGVDQNTVEVLLHELEVDSAAKGGVLLLDARRQAASKT